MKIDVVMLTRNSNKPWFRRVLNAIYENIPVHCFIVVDGCSMDGTIDAIKSVFKEKVKVLRTHTSLGGARYLGMKLVDTEWFAFIDSDVEILEGWFDEAKNFMSHKKIPWHTRRFYSPS